MTDREFTEFVSSRTVKMIELDAVDLPLFNKPIVYMAIGANDKVLYVGMSKNGLSRAFGRNHHIIPKIYNEIISLQIYQTKTLEDAITLEHTMIREFKPIYNNRMQGKIKKCMMDVQMWVARERPV